jgi:pilus assembly protein Flp/PilA
MSGEILEFPAVPHIMSLSLIKRNSEERRKYPMLFAPKERGQGLVEYALILVLVAIVVIAALMILGPIIGNTFSTINSSLSGV